jgi:hypothetical protein
MGARFSWVYRTQLVPSSEFRTLSTVFFSHGPPALFHAGGTLGVPSGPMKHGWWLNRPHFTSPDFPLQGSLPTMVEPFDGLLLPWTSFCAKPRLLRSRSSEVSPIPGRRWTCLKSADLPEVLDRFACSSVLLGLNCCSPLSILS